MVDRPLEPGILVMNRGMLLGIEQSAEGATPARSAADRITFACVVIAVLGLVAILFSRRRWPWTLVASVGACLVTLVFFVWYPSVRYGILLVAEVFAALVWTYPGPLTGGLLK